VPTFFTIFSRQESTVVAGLKPLTLGQCDKCSTTLILLLEKLFSFVFSLPVQETSMELYHALDGITNLKYKLLYFLTPNKKKLKRKALAFIRDRCCHLAICLQLILFHLDPTLGLGVMRQVFYYCADTF
jgi:hypothetical protein